ncbi:hypothetical protein [Streptomyces sp. SBT349]|uniref:hypothetical protein n=1 Tax=Streptomyces sp. SBT349 TaxID=1580539 RepID=UPI00066D62DC|nr:hypothetical protein [Streptomyces sp. SBT349]
MRSPYERPACSATPIYDSLCAEYRRLFRTLPGDRSGEEDLRFVGFSTSYGVGAGSWREWHDPAYSGYGAMGHAPVRMTAALPPARHAGDQWDPHEARGAR